VYQESESVDLLLVAFLSPIMAASVRAIRLPGKRWFIGAYLALVTGYVFTVAEGFVWPDAFNVLEHASYALSGVLFAVAGFRLRAASRIRVDLR
jgi:hypothetical protein